MYDPFERTTDLLNCLFPLFTAVISFWYGVTIEGRRADQSKEMADKAEKSSQVMQTRMTSTERELQGLGDSIKQAHETCKKMGGIKTEEKQEIDAHFGNVMKKAAEYYPHFHFTIKTNYLSSHDAGRLFVQQQRSDRC